MPTTTIGEDDPQTVKPAIAGGNRIPGAVAIACGLALQFTTAGEWGFGLIILGAFLLVTGWGRFQMGTASVIRVLWRIRAVRITVISVGALIAILIGIALMIPEPARPPATPEQEELRAQLRASISGPLIKGIELSHREIAEAFKIEEPLKPLPKAKGQEFALLEGFNRTLGVRVCVTGPAENLYCVFVTVALDSGKITSTQDSHQLLESFLNEVVSPQAWGWILATVNDATEQRTVVHDVRRTFGHRDLVLNVNPMDNRAYGTLDVSIFAASRRIHSKQLESQ
jgi:hypothetical protein